ncbi:MAG: hypothetical protein GY906_07775 [bacterium]|nr:hypothetical protein [bacterium]
MPKDESFEKLEPANLVVLGDKKGQSKAFGGLLVGIVPDEQYPDKVRYVCVGKDGEDYEVTGNAALSRRIKHTHIGCLIKFKFLGMQRGQRNQFKEIEVMAQPREHTTDAQKEMFPRWHDFEDGAASAAEAEEGEQQSEDDEDLGF